MHDAYLAGFIDGEGCIQVRLRTRSHYTEPHYDIRLQIGQKIVEPLKALQEVYGGCLTLRSPTTYNRCWLLTWHSRADVLRILTIIALPKTPPFRAGVQLHILQLCGILIICILHA